MPSTTLAAHAPEFDLGRVVFIIMLLVGGFLQWLMKWWKQKQAEAEAMRRQPATPEEVRARERAWRREIGAEDQIPPPPAARNPLEELLKTFRDLATPEVVVPLVPVQSPPKIRAVPVVEIPRSVPASAKVTSAPAAIVEHRPRHPLAVKLAAIGGLRQAVVLREVLGPPKALQTADDHLI